jgi:hypothetical protein
MKNNVTETNDKKAAALNDNDVKRPREPYSPLDLVRFVVGTAKLFEDALPSAEVPKIGRKRTVVTLMHFHVLDRLANSENRWVLQSDLVSAPETAKSSAMSSLLQWMEDEDEWITRELPPSRKRQAQMGGQEAGNQVDRRQRIVRLTKQGLQVWKEVKPKFEANLNQHLENFSIEEIGRLAEDIRKLREQLKAKKKVKGT